MRGHSLTTHQLLQRIQEEFDEAPGLVITVNQGARFWAIDPKTCERVLARLQADGFLVKAADGYVKRRATI